MARAATHRATGWPRHSLSEQSRRKPYGIETHEPGRRPKASVGFIRVFTHDLVEAGQTAENTMTAYQNCRWIRAIEGSGAALRAALLFALFSFLSSTAAFPQFPNGPVRWILPEPTGGNFDALARGIAPVLAKNLRVPVVVQNIPGPEGVNQVYRAKPDGQIIGMLDPMGELAREIVMKPDFNVHEMTWLGRINAGTN